VEKPSYLLGLSGSETPVQALIPVNGACLRPSWKPQSNTANRQWKTNVNRFYADENECFTPANEVFFSSRSYLIL
jgi:hypothetical protein